MIKDIGNIGIDVGATLLDALKQMDRISRKLLLVLEGGRYRGLLSIGDIHRAIIRNIDLNSAINRILQTEGRVVAKPGDPIEQTKTVMLQHRTEFMPVVNEEGELVDLFFWEDLFIEKEPSVSKGFNLPVVIMAGGLGTRLKPLTNVLPKPLIPIGEKTMLEEIFDRFARFGSKRFHISLNYKAALIKYYINSLDLDYEIDYFEEGAPSGTAGSLNLLKGKINETFFVTNCDILVDQDYSEILDFHTRNRNEITVVAAVKNFPIAYGTIETGDNGNLVELVEKPEMTFKINTGMYILEAHLIYEIPEGVVFNLTDLIADLQASRRNVGVFPVWHTCWTDIGDWNEYMSRLRSVT